MSEIPKVPARLGAGVGGGVKQITEVVNIFVETFFECMSIVTEDRTKTISQYETPNSKR